MGAIFNFVPPREPVFIGREGTLATLAEVVQPGSAPVAVIGPSGIGKSAVVTKFVYDHSRDEQWFPAGVLWMSGVWSKSLRKQAMAGLGQFDILEQDITDKMISDLLKDKELLLVFDDLDTAECASLLRLVGERCACIIITVERTALPIQVAPERIIELAPLGEVTTMQVFATWPRHGTQQPLLEQVAARTQGVPLFITRAARYFIEQVSDTETFVEAAEHLLTNNDWLQAERWLPEYCDNGAWMSRYRISDKLQKER
jgi:NB-ARC domain